MVGNSATGMMTGYLSRPATSGVEGVVFRFKRYAIHDGPGIRTTVFLKGCPLECTWCHNPEGQDFRPRQMAGGPATGGRPLTVGRQVTVARVVAEAEKDLVFYDDSGGGVTFSGGEPLAQPDFILALLATCRHRRLHTVLDTSGFAPPELFLDAARLSDLVLFDLKIIDPDLHRKYTGVNNRQILSNFRAACRAGIPMRVRVPLIPEITATEANLHRLGAFLSTCRAGCPVDLLPYHRIGEDKYRRLGIGHPGRIPGNLDKARIRQAREILAGYDLKVSVGG